MIKKLVATPNPGPFLLFIRWNDADQLTDGPSWEEFIEHPCVAGKCEVIVSNRDMRMKHVDGRKDNLNVIIAFPTNPWSRCSD